MSAETSEGAGECVENRWEETVLETVEAVMLDRRFKKPRQSRQRGPAGQAAKEWAGTRQARRKMSQLGK